MAVAKSQVKLVASASQSSGRKARLEVSADGTARAYIDRNKNKKLDAGDALLRASTLFYDADNDGLFDAGEVVLTTSKKGRFAFGDLPITDVGRVRAM